MIALVALLPLFSAILIAFLYLREYKDDTKLGYLASLAPIASFIITFILFLSHTHSYTYELFEWLQFESFSISIAFYVDHLSLFMALFVTFIGSLIHIYSIYYMQNEDGFGKFFVYLNLFMASMLILVLANNPIFMFVGWEGVGVCSYLLISFYYKDSANVLAGNKAFIVNRVGDFGFILGIGLLFWAVGDSGFDYLSISESMSMVDSTTVGLVALLLFVGASAKSAQIPLYVWLPDAMAGPTPVSALIHAATMVTAGIYMIARFSFLYIEAVNISLMIAYIGIATSLISALIATRQSDIKKILAYSTVSQLGYMFVAVGLGAYSAGLFHVFTHAFFKALLFLGAGAIILSLHHEQNVFKMGNLKNKLKPIYITMLIATLAISGIFPFSGFFSKDEILFSAFSSGHYDIWVIGVFIAFLTPFYMFRMMYLVFFAHSRDIETHSVPNVMKYVLYILAFGSIFAGLLGIPTALGGDNIIHHYLSSAIYTTAHHTASDSTALLLMGINTLVATLGIYVAYKRYYIFSKEKETKWNNIIKNKFYVDEFYDRFFVKRVDKLSSFCENTINKTVIENIVKVVLNSYTRGCMIFTTTQNGNTRAYTLYILIGISSIFLYLFVR
jgi:NADH-quinone oxidoreductase subunit L